MRIQQASALALLLVALAAGPVLSITWEEERLQWLVVTRPGENRVQLNCTSEHIYPFTLLNDSSIIGTLGSLAKRIWWVLPDATLANATYDDGNRACVDNGVGLLVRQVTEGAYGLYHCAVEASTMVNDSYIDRNSTTVYYYKRGLNLYGPDLYGGDTWEKYKRNTLIGGLSAGIFLLSIAWYAILNRLGVLAKCRGRSNAVDSLQQQQQQQQQDGNAGPTTTSTASIGARAMEEEEATEMKAATPAAVENSSRASVRSRQSDRGAAGMETTA